MADLILDVSYHQGTIDWSKVSQQVKLTILRVQYGSNKFDSKYNEYVKGCEANGLPHAAYAYGCYISVNDAIKEADDFMARTSKNAKFLVLDVEDDTLASCGPTKLAEASQAFIDRCKANGWKVGLYLSHHMYTQYGLNKVKADFLWIPRYGTNNGQPQVKPDFACDIWQFTDKGKVNGIAGYCDLNYLNGGKSLSWFLGKDSSSSEVGTSDGYRPEGIGIATSKYPVGYGVNLYNAPDGHFTGEAIKDKTGYLILEGVWYGGDKNMLCLGWEQWVPQEHVDVQWFKAHSKYPSGYGINTYSAPGAPDGTPAENAYKGNVDGSIPYDIYSRKNGWLDLGGQTFVKEEHFIVK